MKTIFISEKVGIIQPGRDGEGECEGWMIPSILKVLENIDSDFKKGGFFVFFYLII
jgi:hypothetical protein